MQEEYVQGFMAKCAAAGIDPEELLKESRELTEDSERANATGGRIGGVLGGVTGLRLSALPALLAGGLKGRPLAISAGVLGAGAGLGAATGVGLGRGLVPNRYEPESKVEMLKKKFRELVAQMQG